MGVLRCRRGKRNWAFGCDPALRPGARDAPSPFEKRLDTDLTAD